MIAWGATGLTQLNETGELNGGCTVEAQSDVDTTIMTDTTRQNPVRGRPRGWPFLVGDLARARSWTTPGRSGSMSVASRWSWRKEARQTPAENLENSGDVPDISVYVEEVTEISGQQIRGVVRGRRGHRR